MLWLLADAGSGLAEAFGLGVGFRVYRVQSFGFIGLRTVAF